MKKKIALVLLCLVVVFAAGCGNKTSDLPVLEDIELAANMEEASSGGYTAQYDADQWVFDDTLGFAIYDKEIYESGNPDGNCPNVNVVVSQAYKGPLTEDDMDSIISQVESLGITGFKIDMNEMRAFMDEPVIYYEATVALTDDMIDLMIEQGAITEADIEALGGREALMESGSTNQAAVCAIVDGNIIIVTGTYYDDAQKDTIVDAIKMLIKTGSVG